MISLDQVILLEQKIESAVAKIQQLQAENDALRNKCAELTNALSAKSEQLSSFETDQNQIEAGIKKALDRLNAIENSVLKAETIVHSGGQAAKPVTPQVQPAPLNTPIVENPVEEEIQEESAPDFNMESDFAVQSDATEEETVAAEEPSSKLPSFDTMDALTPDEEFSSEDDSQDGLGFDIF